MSKVFTPEGEVIPEEQHAMRLKARAPKSEWEMKRAILRRVVQCQSPLNPPPADPRCAHPPKRTLRLVK